MSTSKSVSAGGVIRGLSNTGFTPRDLPAEGFDNSIDAKATFIRMIVEDTKMCYFVDNGPGMDRKKLEQRFVLFKDKEASDDCQGRFGIGENVKHSLLTGNEKPSMTISRTMAPPKTNPKAAPVPHLSQIELDWPSASNRETDEYVLFASDASRASEEIWRKYAIDPEGTGTIDMIPLCDSMFKYFTEQTKDYVPHYERMYAKELRNGLTLEVYVLGKTIKLVGHNILVDSENDNETTKDFKQLDVWEKADGELRIYFKNSSQKFVYQEPKSTKHNPTHPPKKEEGFTHVGAIRIEFSYNPRWRKLYELGGIYYNRNTKMIERHMVPEPRGGDFGEQDIIKSCRACVSFPVKCDSLFGIEINKSRIKGIKPQLKEEIEKFVVKFARDVYKRSKPAPVVPAPVVPAPVVSAPVVPAPAPVVPAPVAPAPVVPVPAGPQRIEDILKIQLKPTAASDPKPSPVVATPVLRMNHSEFVSKYIVALKEAHPDWEHKQAFAQAAVLWNSYKATGVEPTIVKPTTVAQSLPPAPPSTNIQFTKDSGSTTLSILEGATVLAKLPIVGQPHIWETMLKQVLESKGVPRFKEFIAGLVQLNMNYLA